MALGRGFNTVDFSLVLRCGYSCKSADLTTFLQTYSMQGKQHNSNQGMEPFKQ